MSTTISGTTGIDKVQDGTTINASSIMGALNATGTAPIYACRAWVNFNGTGTVAIRASGNVSSITDNGTGDYTVNFTTAMVDEKSSVSVTGQRNLVNNMIVGMIFADTVPNIFSTAVRVLYKDQANGAQDPLICCVSIFR